MIVDRDSLFDRISSHGFCRETRQSTAEKIAAFDKAVSDAVRSACSAFDSETRVHLTYSGGVDSSIALYKMADAGVSVTAHTMANAQRHPDLVHARSVTDLLRQRGCDIVHAVHILSPRPHDTAESNRLLGANDDHPDNYYMLMKVLAPHTKMVVSSDCIDELLGGYHMHRDPASFFPLHDAGASVVANRLAALRHYLSLLVPEHLAPMQAFSEHFGVDVILPYGAAGVMSACESFAVSEMVDDRARKKPVYEIASRLGLPSEVLTRRKYGLVSAFHEVTA